ncbi:MAG: RluA family pseudouridine synthase [Deltaproteobacteria bacterium]|nr:RluA family pseudouridine synthase [Deltaproteobacteria bacterium]
MTRLDQLLFARRIAPSRSQIARWIREGRVLVNEKPAKASRKIREGDRVCVNPPEARPAKPVPEKIPLDVLFEDSDLIVINKPAFMVVHPGAGHETGTLTNALLAHCKDLSGIGGVMRPGIVHRLDKGTSGAMVIAKNDRTHIALSEQFKKRKVKKIYWAVVYGKMKKPTGTFSGFISRSPSHRKKFSVSETKGKEAVTHYRMLKEGKGLSLLELKLETGRTRQIRVHLTNAGHGVVGDPLYGGHMQRTKQIQNAEARNFLRALDHTLLHARCLAFCHPGTNETMEFEAKLPEDFERAVDLCF